MSAWQRKPAYHQIYWSDFLDSTMTMSDDGAHAYLFLLGRAWSNDGYLKNDDDFLRRAARMSPRRWKACREEVLERFKTDDQGRFFNSRILSDLQTVNQKREIQKRKAETRWAEKSNKNNDRDYAAASQRDLPTHPSPTPTPSSIDSESNTPVRTKDSDSQSHTNNCPSSDGGLIPFETKPPAKSSKAKPHSNFEEWWECWDISGTKKEKSGAKAKYDAAIRSRKVDHELLCRSVRDLMDHHRRCGTSPQFIPYPKTWLHNGRWDDELVPDRPMASASGGSGAVPEWAL